MTGSARKTFGKSSHLAVAAAFVVVLSLAGMASADAYTDVKVGGRAGSVWVNTSNGAEGSCSVPSASWTATTINISNKGPTVTGWRTPNGNTTVGYIVWATEVETGRTFWGTPSYFSVGTSAARLPAKGIVATRTTGNHLRLSVMVAWYDPGSGRALGNVGYALTTYGFTTTGYNSYDVVSSC